MHAPSRSRTRGSPPRWQRVLTDVCSQRPGSLSVPNAHNVAHTRPTRMAKVDRTTQEQEWSLAGIAAGGFQGRGLNLQGVDYILTGAITDFGMGAKASTFGGLSRDRRRRRWPSTSGSLKSLPSQSAYPVKVVRVQSNGEVMFSYGSGLLRWTICSMCSPKGRYSWTRTPERNWAGRRNSSAIFRWSASNPDSRRARIVQGDGIADGMLARVTNEVVGTRGRVKEKRELFYEKGTPFLLAAPAIRVRVVAETGATM